MTARPPSASRPGLRPATMLAMADRAYIFDLTPQSLADYLEPLGMPAFRARQVIEWVYQHGITDVDAMTNLSKADRAKLRNAIRFKDASIVKHQVATDGVQKLLVRWDSLGSTEAAGTDSERNRDHPLPLASEPHDHPPSAHTSQPWRETECVMIPADGSITDEGKTRPRKTACISSQVGCPVGCRFCASGLGGLDADLTAGQIVEQVWQLQQLPGVERISNIVFMGMGEPLANFDAVAEAIRTLMAEWAFGISGRRITVSTVGLPAQMRRLADLALPVTLAISLHAPNDELRRELIPWAEYVTVKQLLDAGRYYFDRTGREITLEYILIRNVNDRSEHARELASIAKTLRANVNLIRYNEVRELPFGRPANDDVLQFQATLRAAGINTHIRASRGRDIAAACGQLRHEGTG